jgi:hypothetical protein
MVLKEVADDNNIPQAEKLEKILIMNEPENIWKERQVL